MSAILEVSGLTKQYSKSDFKLDSVSFTLPKGRIMGLVGENGAGKTTMIGCILGTLKKDSGEVKIFGEEMQDSAVHIRENIGVVYDAIPFLDYFTPKQIAYAMGHIYTKWDDQLFSEFLEKFKLSEEQKISKFSRGMTMKLAVAVALSYHPKLLILDEATSGLDPVVRDDILDVFLDFVSNEENSILFSSHITSDLERIADYITFMQDGQIVFSEEKDQMKFGYGVMRLSSAQFDALDPEEILAYRRREFQVDVLVKDRGAMVAKYPGMVVEQATIEEIILMTVKGEQL